VGRDFHQDSEFRFAMPHRQNAKKALRQSDKIRLRNRSERSALRTLVRKFQAALENADASPDDREQLFRQVTKRLDQSAAKNLIHRNKASRTKSRLSARLRAANTANS